MIFLFDNINYITHMNKDMEITNYQKKNFNKV